MNEQTIKTQDVEVETTTTFEDGVQEMMDNTINEENVDFDVNVVSIDGYVESKKAVGYGIGGAILSGAVGFVSGAIYGKMRREKLLEVIVEEIHKIGSGEEVLEPKEKQTRVSTLTDQIMDKLQDKKISEKEKQKWREAFSALITLSAVQGIKDAAHGNNDTIVDEGEN